MTEYQRKIVRLAVELLGTLEGEDQLRRALTVQGKIGEAVEQESGHRATIAALDAGDDDGGCNLAAERRSWPVRFPVHFTAEFAREPDVGWCLERLVGLGEIGAAPRQFVASLLIDGPDSFLRQMDAADPDNSGRR